MPAVLDVNPEHYAAASASMGQDLAPGLAHAFDDLTRGLAGSGAMAGHDSSGRVWGAQYDLAAPQALAAIATVERAALKLATLLQRTGFNHAEAESMSTAQRNGGVPDEIVYTASAQSTNTCGQVPVATGGTGDYPTEWSLIRAGVGFEWPDGNPAKLRTAAAAWSTAAKTIAGLEIVVDRAVAAINLQQSPEVADAVTVCGSMRAHLAAVASSCAAIGRSCSDLASSIETAHHEAIHEMKVLIVTSTGVQVLGAICAVVTLGFSEMAAQTVEAVEIGVVRGKVIRILSALAIRARAIEVELSALKSKVVQVGRSLRPILESDVVVAETTAVPGLPGVTATESVEVTAGTRLKALAIVKAGRSNRWTDEATLLDHVSRHGADFGLTSPTQYTDSAVAFIERAIATGLPMKVDSAGTVRVYEPATNTFASMAKDGRIKTYFKPNRDHFWEDQTGKLVSG